MLEIGIKSCHDLNVIPSYTCYHQRQQCTQHKVCLKKIGGYLCFQKHCFTQSISWKDRLKPIPSQCKLQKQNITLNNIFQLLALILLCPTFLQFKLAKISFFHPQRFAPVSGCLSWLSVLKSLKARGLLNDHSWSEQIIPLASKLWLMDSVPRSFFSLHDSKFQGVMKALLIKYMRGNQDKREIPDKYLIYKKLILYSLGRQCIVFK